MHNTKQRGQSPGTHVLERALRATVLAAAAAPAILLGLRLDQMVM
jgi:hypothetical protein